MSAKPDPARATGPALEAIISTFADMGIQVFEVPPRCV